MINEQNKYSDLISKVIGCAKPVHATFKNGFQEVIYQRVSAIEYSLADISFSPEFEMPIFYPNQQIRTRLVDNFVERSLIFKRLQNKQFKNKEG